MHSTISKPENVNYLKKKIQATHLVLILNYLFICLIYFIVLFLINYFINNNHTKLNQRNIYSYDYNNFNIIFIIY